MLDTEFVRIECNTCGSVCSVFETETHSLPVTYCCYCGDEAIETFEESSATE